MRYVKICPKCGSIDITIPNAGLDFKMTIKDKCSACSFRGNFPEVEVNQIEEFRKKIKNGQNNI